jgi:hypothetical protein
MSDHHTSVLTWTEAIDLMETVNPALAHAMKSLEKANRKSVYLTRYRFGDALIDNQGKLRPPCHECNSCKDLQQACGNDLPLAIVTDQCVEVHLRSAYTMGTIPLRVLGAGESFGLFELLDQLYPQAVGVARPPQWQVVAGAKSVYITSPFCTEPLGKAVRSLLPEDIVKAHFSRRAGKSVAQQLTGNPYLFIRYLEKAALRAADVQGDHTVRPWTATALIFPSSVLLPALSKKASFIDAAKEFLLQIHGAAWIQSRNLRLRDVEAAEIEQHVKNESNKVKHDLGKAIQHVLAIARGDLPAFVPYSDKLMAGPFSTVHNFFLSAELKGKLAESTFPAILQPCHLGRERGQSVFGYFSLSLPSMIGCGKSFDNDFAEKLCDYLSDGNFPQQFGVSLYNTLDRPIMRSDFDHQFRIAKDKWDVSEGGFFRDFKQGFTVRFMRIEQNAAASLKSAATA